ncbi:MAG: IS66 family insertion sequence element accessory protein TnpB [Actinomycetota bacterium]
MSWRLTPSLAASFVFTNKRRISVKILVTGGRGFWLAKERLSSGRFRFWPKGSSKKTALKASGFNALIWGQYPSLQDTMLWRKIRRLIFKKELLRLFSICDIS